MIKAFLIGISVALIASALGFAILRIPVLSMWAFLFSWLSLIGAAFVTAYLAPNHKVALSILLAIVITLVGGGFNFVFELMGNESDFSGIKGTLLLIGILLPFNALLCSIGGIAGYYISGLHKKH